MGKKNNLPEDEPLVIDKEILRTARMALQPEKTPATVRCSICNSDAAPNSAESLCWVCRRLKISAWRDSDQQMPAQE